LCVREKEEESHVGEGRKTVIAFIIGACQDLSERKEKEFYSKTEKEFPCFVSH